MRRWSWLVAWLGWIALYVVLSSRVGSSENSAEWLIALLKAIHPMLAERMTPEMLHALNFLVRKGAHFCGFAILTCLGYRMFCDTFGLAPPVALRWAIITGILRAFLDEWQQSFVPGRSATLMDVGIDTAGILTMALWLRSRGRQPSTRVP